MPRLVPRRSALLATLLLLAGACGGGGGSGTTSQPTPSLLDIGTVASTVPDRTEVAFPNPLAGDATVTEALATGPFTVDQTDLPAPAPAGGSATLHLVHAALGEGVASGDVTLRFEGPGGPEDRTWIVRATGERVTWGLVTPSLDFGAVDAAQTKDLTAQAINLSTLSPVTFTGVTLPGAFFSVVGSPFPMTVDPGATASVTIRYAPTQAGIHDGTLVLGPADPGGGVDISVLAETVGSGNEEVTDYGSLPLDSGGRTSVLAVSVPADAISVTVEGAIPNGVFTTPVIGLDTWTGPGGKVYENSSGTGAYVWYPEQEVFDATVPNTDRANVQLVPGGGTYHFSLRRLQGTGANMIVRAIVERRTAGGASGGTLDLNVWLANGITPKASTAATDNRLQAILTRIDSILSQQGVRIGSIDYYDVTDSSFDQVTSNTEFANMLRLSSAATRTRLNLYFVQVAFGGGVVGVSATIGGPKLNGTGVSGVMSIYDGYGTSTIGLIAAHELGHYLGLYHTVEQDGTHDFVDDTLNCPASGTDSVCTTAGGGYLMHWQAVGGSSITDGQGGVIRGHPTVAAPAGAFLMSKPVVVPADAGEVLSLPQDWCGTCRSCLTPKGAP